MKSVWKTILVYSLIMLALLGAIILVYNSISLSNDNIASYSNEELSTYKKVWESINESFENSRGQMLKFSVIIWTVIFALGNLFIILIYHFQLRPVEEMEEYALEIAKGNLDVPLPRRKGSRFGSLPESFDLMRESLKKAKQKEMEAEKAKKELMGELSHDLKTPVSTIQATCEVLDMIFIKNKEKLIEEKSLSEAENNEYLDKKLKEIDGILEKTGYIRAKAETISNLVDNLFRATIDDMDEITTRPQETDSKLVESFFNSIKEYGNIILDNHIPECLVYLDKLRMEQVIDNIAGNSYKYAGTDIHVSFTETELLTNVKGNRNNFIKITIRDSGPGVPESDLPLLTEKFHRGSNSGDRQGYGLGMYLANMYMEKQGGGMEYYNDNGFVVELLIKKV